MEYLMLMTMVTACQLIVVQIALILSVHTYIHGYGLQLLKPWTVT